MFLVPLSERDLELLVEEEGTGGNASASLGSQCYDSNLSVDIEGITDASSTDKRVPTEEERADGFLNDARIEASSAEKQVPAEGERAKGLLDEAGIETSLAEKWSDPVREGVTTVWSLAGNRSEFGSSGNTGCGRSAIRGG